MEDLKKLEVKNWKEIAKDRRTWRELDQKAKTHRGVVVPPNDGDKMQSAAANREHELQLFEDKAFMEVIKLKNGDVN